MKFEPITLSHWWSSIPKVFKAHVGSNNLLHIVFNVGYFKTIPRCYSRIGRDPNDKEQVISIGLGCERLGTVVHETMHALGFFHEHTRPDRDKYITLDWGNIEQGKWNTVFFFFSWKILIILGNVYKGFRLSFVSRLSLRYWEYHFVFLFSIAFSLTLPSAISIFAKRDCVS